MIESLDIVCHNCSETNAIRILHCICQVSLVDRICQVVIAAFAVFGTVVALFKCKIDKRLNSPVLDVHFSERSPYYLEVDSTTEGGDPCDTGTNKRISLKIGVENIGPYTANGCKVKLLSVTIADGNKDLPIRAASLQKQFARVDHAEEAIESGGRCLFELGEICADNAEKSLTDGEETAKSYISAPKACIELRFSDGSSERLRPHQSHIKVLIALCAEDFAPRKYSLTLHWKGDTVADIGTVGAFECSAIIVKK